MKLKIKSHKGFSISEMLMAVLMISLVGLVIGGGVTVVRNSYMTITQKAEAQTLRSTALITVMNEMRYAQNIESQTEGLDTFITFDSPSRGYRIYYSDGKITETDKYTQILVNNATGTNPTALVTDRTITSGLIPHISYSYHDGKFSLGIWVTDSSGTKILAGKAGEEDITIAPLNS